MSSFINCDNLTLQNFIEIKTDICPIEKIKLFVYNYNTYNIIAINICSVRKYFDELC